MSDSGILVVTGPEVAALLDGAEAEVTQAVASAYQAHSRGKSSLPHSIFLRFPERPANRIIGLPGYLGDGFEVAGMKWIASFPGNIHKGLDRASAMMVLNDCETGHPQAILEGSVISAQRTAASAALGAKTLRRGEMPGAAGFVGCGLINLEIARYLRAVWPTIPRLCLFDLDPERAARFKARLANLFPDRPIEVHSELESLLPHCDVLSFATTAGEPYLGDLSSCPPGATVLHISLRDLKPEAILSGFNVVDDADHVCRAQTSIHLTAEQVGNRDFIGPSIGDLLLGHASLPDESAQALTIYSPFGLGVLDLAVAQWVVHQAEKRKLGQRIGQWLPESSAV